MVAEHYEIDFAMIFRLNAGQNLVAEHYIIEIYMIFHFKAVQNLVAEHYERDFDLLSISLESRSKLGRKTLRMRFLHDFSLYGGSTLACRAL